MGTNAAGASFVASTATGPFDVNGVSIGAGTTGTFAYLIQLDETGAVASHATFPYSGTLAASSC